MVERSKPTRVVKEVAAPAVKTKSRARTYTVACKLQSGLRAHIFEEAEEKEPSPLGFRMIKVGRRKPGSPEVIINGCAQYRGLDVPFNVHRPLTHG
jgi:hypothetical protein